MEANLDSSEHDVKAPIVDRSLSPLGLFAAKTVIFTSICAASIVITVALSSSFVEGTVERVTTRIEHSTKIGGAQFWAKAEEALKQAGDPEQSMSPERQKILLGELRNLSNQWKPFLMEAYAILTEPPNASGTPPRLR
jgi:hypothetical protein